MVGRKDQVPLISLLTSDLDWEEARGGLPKLSQQVADSRVRVLDVFLEETEVAAQEGTSRTSDEARHVRSWPIVRGTNIASASMVCGVP